MYAKDCRMMALAFAVFVLTSANQLSQTQTVPVLICVSFSYFHQVVSQAAVNHHYQFPMWWNCDWNLEAILYYIALHFTVLYDTLVYYTILDYTILYSTILYYTIRYVLYFWSCQGWKKIDKDRVKTIKASKLRWRPVKSAAGCLYLNFKNRYGPIWSTVNHPFIVRVAGWPENITHLNWKSYAW